MKLIQWIHEEVTSDFQDLFLCDMEDYNKQFLLHESPILTPLAGFDLNGKDVGLLIILH
jgi:hypothetical protein